MQRISGERLCAVEPTGWYRHVRAFRGHLMKAGPPAVHFRRAAERYHDAWILRTDGHPISFEQIFRSAVRETVKGLLAVTGLAPAYRLWYRWRHPKRECQDLDDETKYAVGLFMTALREIELPNISRVLLYGSRARGGHDLWSDVDIAVILAGCNSGDNSRHALDEHLWDISSKIRSDTTCSPEVSAFALWEDDLSHPEKTENPVFHRNVLADGLEISIDLQPWRFDKIQIKSTGLNEPGQSC